MVITTMGKRRMVAVQRLPRAVTGLGSRRKKRLAFEKSYVARPASCRLARGDVSAYLAGAKVDAHGVDVAVAVAAELFTNALIHHAVRGDESVDVAVRICAEPTGAWIVIAVTDAGHGTISGACDRGINAGEHGRGLLLVRGLGALISGEILEAGYRVTAAFPADEALRARVCRCGCAASQADERAGCLRLVPPIAESVEGAGATASLGSIICPRCRSHGSWQGTRSPSSGEGRTGLHESIDAVASAQTAGRTR